MAKYQNFYNKNYNNKWNNNNHNNRGYNNQGNKNISLDFYNPYSFVPLNNKVYYLNEKEINEINNAHEIPFKESLSGKIEVKFISKTPFCVKGGRESFENTNVNKKYFIPATSLKGMIRNVLEIVSMSNIKNSIDDKRYSMRDLRSNDYLLKGNKSTQKSGFLFQLKGNMYIVECNNERKSYSEINNLINKSIYLKDKNVKDKYSAVGNRFIKYNNKDAMWFFSGNMNNKKHEFLFMLPNNFNKKYIIEEHVFKDFKFIHEKETSSESWKYWKKNLDKNYLSEEEIIKDRYSNLIPCFFRIEDNNNKVKDLGFSYLYRQPYEKSIHKFLPEQYKEEGVDMARSIFGYTSKNSSLKGRVQFKNSFIDKPVLKEECTYILGSPKPTYYPFYLDGGNTYFAKNARLSGYKRYLIHKDITPSTIEKRNNTTTTFIPIDANTEFSVNISFHNLRDYELGALLAAITFCNEFDKCYHSLGYAKPYGYGKLKVTEQPSIIFTDKEIKKDNKELYDTFIKKVCEKCNFKDDTEYYNSISDLFKLAQGNYKDKPIRYPKIGRAGENEFNNIKKCINKNIKLNIFPNK